MKGLFGTFIAFAMCAFLLGACSSAPAKKADNTATASAPVAEQAEESEHDTLVYPQNLDVAHAAYLQAVNLEMRGEHAISEALLRQAYEADPGSRYLGFEVAERLASRASPQGRRRWLRL